MDYSFPSSYNSGIYDGCLNLWTSQNQGQKGYPSDMTRLNTLTHGSPGVIKDDSGHDYDVSYSVTVTATKFEIALGSVVSDSKGKNYMLSNDLGGQEYNCTDAGIHWMVNAGVNLPSNASRNMFTNTPGDYGQAIRQLSNSNKNSGNAPTGHGHCN